MYVFAFVLVGINGYLDIVSFDALLLISTVINGFGDGLAEVVGRKWGANYQYKTHGCCTEYDYVRSYPGSFMVWRSGIVGVAINFGTFTTIQFVIAMVVIPVIGTVTEAKAPHTMDNPFITLFCGLSVLIIASLPV